MDHTDSIVSQHYYWSNSRDGICTNIKVFKTGHKNKNQNKKYGFLLVKEVGAISWYRLSVDLVGLYKTIIEVHD